MAVKLNAKQQDPFIYTPGHLTGLNLIANLDVELKRISNAIQNLILLAKDYIAAQIAANKPTWYNPPTGNTISFAAGATHWTSSTGSFSTTGVKTNDALLVANAIYQVTSVTPTELVTSPLPGAAITNQPYRIIKF